MAGYHELPEGLPVPEDDSAADHLPGARVPPLRLARAGGGELDLGAAAEGTLATFVYPRTGSPDVPSPDGWDEIPGARGCTAQSRAFRDLHAELADLGATVLGISAMDSAEQAAFAERERLPYTLLNDPALRLAEALGLPTFDVAGMRLYRRLTFVARERRIVKVFYPVFPPDRNAADVAAWLRERARAAG